MAAVQAIEDRGLKPNSGYFAERDDRNNQTGRVAELLVLDAELVPIGDDHAVPSRFSLECGNVSMDVAIVDGRPKCEALTVRGVSPAYLKRVRCEGLLIQAIEALMVTTVERPAYEFHYPAEQELPADFLEARRVMQDRMGVMPAGAQHRDRLVATRSVRAEMSEADIARAGAAYDEGKIEAVKRTLGVGDRQAWRYVRKAQARGLAARIRAPRKKSSEQ